MSRRLVCEAVEIFVRVVHIVGAASCGSGIPQHVAVGIHRGTISNEIVNGIELLLLDVFHRRRRFFICKAMLVVS